MKILANDGFSKKGIELLESVGFEVFTKKVVQSNLISFINENKIDAILIRSATQVRDDLIDSCPSIKVIGRAGVGLDNIDTQYAERLGIKVVNTPEASSHSVAELVFAHLLGISRSLHDANRTMPLEGELNFKQLKETYANGVEIKGKTLGIIGFGRIGQATAKIAISLGMKVLACDPNVESAELELIFFDGQKVRFNISTISKEEVLKKSDFISLHVPLQESYVISYSELKLMKEGAGIINLSRGGVVDEEALIEAINNNKIAFAGLDVFEDEPTPSIRILMSPYVSLSPHIGASTQEAQERIGIELAEQIIQILGNHKIIGG